MLRTTGSSTTVLQMTPQGNTLLQFALLPLTLLHKTLYTTRNSPLYGPTTLQPVHSQWKRSLQPSVSEEDQHWISPFHQMLFHTPTPFSPGDLQSTYPIHMDTSSKITR